MYVRCLLAACTDQGFFLSLRLTELLEADLIYAWGKKYGLGSNDSSVYLCDVAKEIIGLLQQNLVERQRSQGSLVLKMLH